MLHVHSGGGQGDPHFVTLDGFAYTFNGHGEYILIQADAFQLQGRAQRAIVDNSTSDATIFVALAAKQISPASDTVEVRINSAGNDVGTYHPPSL